MLTNLFKYWAYRVFAPGAVLRSTYDSFQRLLLLDGHCHELMAELQSLYYQGEKKDLAAILRSYTNLADNVEGMVSNLGQMAPGSFTTLPDYFRKFDFYCRFLLAPPPTSSDAPFVYMLTDDVIPVEAVGVKTTNLVTLAHTLGFEIPGGFAVSANSFSVLLEYNNLRPKIDALLREIDLQNMGLLQEQSTQLVALILGAAIPPEIKDSIAHAIEKQWPQTDREQHFAVRSSALGEDGQCSFAGQYKSCLHVKKEDLFTAYLEVLSSKYSPQALAYRIHCGLYDEEAPMAVMILEMVKARAAGVLYTADPGGRDHEKVFIHATPGLGESVVSGQLIPDGYSVGKTGNHLIQRDKGNNEITDRILTEPLLQKLMQQGVAMEHFFEGPQDVEWALHEDGYLVFLQSRPLSIARNENHPEPFPASSLPEPLFQGGVMAAGGINSGKAWCLSSSHPLEKMAHGSVLVIYETLPRYVSVLHKVSCVVAELGSVAGHFATVCREYGVPLLLAVGSDIERIEHGQPLIVSADECAVYIAENQAFTQPVPAYERDKDLPFYRKLKALLSFITPLQLVDPQSKEFMPESCRSFHDIIRFSHEMAMQTMFGLGDRLGGRGMGRRLQTELPFDVNLVDVGGGLKKEASDLKLVKSDQVLSAPFQALWRGLNHPEIAWGEQHYYDWQGYDRMAMSDAFAVQSRSDAASYAVLAKEYLNINIRFGYHFTVVDALCEPDAITNYCFMRFAGGGGDFTGRMLRIEFLTTILERLGFVVTVQGDLLGARVDGIASGKLLHLIESLGVLLGVTKQMDMHLKDTIMVEQQVESFFALL